MKVSEKLRKTKNHKEEKKPPDKEQETTSAGEAPPGASSKKIPFCQILIVSILNIAQLNIGLGLGYPAILLPQLFNADNSTGVYVSPEETGMISMIASFLSLGQIIGCPIAAFIAYQYGRKITVLSSCIPGIIGWFLIAFGPERSLIVVGRLLTGIGMGMDTSVHTMYVCELSSTAWRSFLAGSAVMCIMVGIFLIYVVGTLANYDVAGAIVGGMLVAEFFLTFLVPESPVWLLQHGRKKAARKSARRMGRNETELESEVGVKLDGEDEKHKGSGGINCNVCTQACSRLSDRDVYTPFIVLNILFFVQNWSGPMTIVFYAVTIIKDANTGMDPNEATIMIGGLQVIAAVLGLVLVHYCKRNILLLISTFTVGLAMCCLGGTVYGNVEKTMPESMSWMPVLWMIVFLYGFNIGLGNIPWVLMGELYPADVRAIFVPTTTCLCMTYITLCSFLWTYMSDVNALNSYGTFWLYSAVGFFGFGFVLCFLPETKGKTMDELAKLWPKKSVSSRTATEIEVSAEPPTKHWSAAAEKEAEKKQQEKQEDEEKDTQMREWMRDDKTEPAEGEETPKLIRYRVVEKGNRDKQHEVKPGERSLNT